MLFHIDKSSLWPYTSHITIYLIYFYLKTINQLEISVVYIRQYFYYFYCINMLVIQLSVFSLQVYCLFFFPSIWFSMKCENARFFNVFFVVNMVIDTRFIPVPWIIYGQYHQPQFRFPSGWKQATQQIHHIDNNFLWSFRWKHISAKRKKEHKNYHRI